MAVQSLAQEDQTITPPSVNPLRTWLRVEQCEDRTTPTPAVTASVIAHATESGSSGQIRFARDDTTGSLSVNFSLGGTATSGTDYATPISPVFFMPGAATVDMFVGTYGDSDSEPTETVVVTVTSGTGYTIGSPASATMNIYDDDAQVVSVAQVADAAEGGSSGTLRFTRIGDLSSSLTANFSVSGTATSGTDYTSIGTTVAFTAGAAAADKTVAALDDVVYDPGETVIVTVTSGSGYTVGSPSAATAYITDDEGPPVYWVGGNGASWSTAANWSSNAVPNSSTAVYFSSSYSNYGVTTPSTDVTLGELHFVGSYSGTVTLDGDLTVGKLELASAGATLDQPSGATSGSDVTVTAAMVWTGGTLNSTNHLAELTLTGTDTWATFAPTSAGTVNSGSSINLSNGAVATLKGGTLEFTNEDTEINLNDDSGMLVDVAAPFVQSIEASFTIVHGGQLNIKDQAWVDVVRGEFLNTTPLKNTGGSFILRPDTHASFAGKVDNVNGGPAVQQTAGVIYLYKGSILEVGNAEFGLLMSGGALSIQLDQGTGPAEIIGNVKVTGGDVISGANASGDTHLFGTLKVEGNVNWIGGTYRPYVEAESDWGGSDVWYVTGTFTIGGTAALVPVAVDGENNATTPPSNYHWLLLEADTGFANNNTPSFDGDLWILDSVGNPRTRWDLRSK